MKMFILFVNALALFMSFNSYAQHSVKHEIKNYILNDYMDYKSVRNSSDDRSNENLIRLFLALEFSDGINAISIGEEIFLISTESPMEILFWFSRNVSLSELFVEILETSIINRSYSNGEKKVEEEVRQLNTVLTDLKDLSYGEDKLRENLLKMLKSINYR